MARPFGTLKYDNLADLEAGIEEYFNDCDAKPVLNAEGNPVTDKHGSPIFHPPKPYTMEGLAYSLNIDVRTLSNYGKDENYFPAINRARQKCLVYKSERLYDKDGVQGAKFDLCNNSERMGGLKYSDKQEYSVTAEIQPDAETLKSQLHDLISGLSAEEKRALSGD